MNRVGKLLLAALVTLQLSADLSHDLETYGRSSFSKVIKSVWEDGYPKCIDSIWYWVACAFSLKALSKFCSDLWTSMEETALEPTAKIFSNRLYLFFQFSVRFLLFRRHCRVFYVFQGAFQLRKLQEVSCIPKQSLKFCSSRIYQFYPEVRRNQIWDSKVPL